MKRTVILHQMTAMNVPLPQLPKLAADIGCREVSLFTYVPQSGLPEENADGWGRHRTANQEQAAAGS